MQASVPPPASPRSANLLDAECELRYYPLAGEANADFDTWSKPTKGGCLRERYTPDGSGRIVPPSPRMLNTGVRE